MKPSRHDHVGHMMWTDTESSCTGCGQRWVLTNRGWVVTVTGADDDQPTTDERRV